MVRRDPDKKTRVLIAGGGTGGHLFPGIALAEELRERGCEVCFVGTRRGLEVRAVPRAGFPLELIEIGGLKGMGFWGFLRGLLRVPRALLQSGRILRAFLPDVVVGVGGYASGPVVLRAWLACRPTVVLEQNALPGFTNRVLGRLARRVVVAFPEALSRFGRRALLLGNPVRRELLAARAATAEPRSGGPVLFAFGGSQGARALNRLVPEAVARLAGVLPGLKVIHQTGEREREEVAARYAQAGLGERAEVLAFIDDMAGAYRRADLVVCRAGATTVTELALCHVPALLVPFPQAADNHQEVNAKSLVAAGAAVMLRERELDAERLAAAIGALFADPGRLEAMRERAFALARPEAAAEVARLCLHLAGREESA